MRTFTDVQPEVWAAARSGKPVVALESAIITHGMPYPSNLSVAREVEAIVRAEGALPATIAVIGGRIKVGLSDADLERLATANDTMKLSVRDLPVAIAREATGGTTVAATATIAEAAGIAVFVTGGIGGVHRGALTGPAHVWDVSADLNVLGRRTIAVVCAGAKAVLDIAATLEVLETLGVTVLGYGTDRFPGFYTRDAGFAVPARADSPSEAADIIQARLRSGLPGGVLVVNPIPAADALDSDYVQEHIGRALADMADRGISGGAVTPFLLSRLEAITEGRSLAANKALIRNNARVGAQIAVALSAPRKSIGFGD